MADDGLEDFLAELEGTTTTSNTPARSTTDGVNATITSGNPSASFVLDDELADIFGVDATPSKSFAADTTSTSISNSGDVPPQVDIQPTNKDDGDILSWLGDSPPRAAVEAASAKKSSAVPSTVDNFFDEVFGDSGAPLSPIMTKRAETMDVHNEIFEAVHSSFPDVAQIGSLIHRAGYIPTDLRGLVWCLLLTGATTEDHEADYYHPTGAELADVSRLNADVDALITRMAPLVESAGIDLVQCRQDLHDILVLYCVRRQVDYIPLYCSLLAPLIVTTRGAMARSLASSCFYSLTTGFVPIINLKVRLFDDVVQQVILMC
jgi:hypothetical protein